jgi:hypothetical protein
LLLIEFEGTKSSGYKKSNDYQDCEDQDKGINLLEDVGYHRVSADKGGYLLNKIAKNNLIHKHQD